MFLASEKPAISDGITLPSSTAVHGLHMQSAGALVVSCNENMGPWGAGVDHDEVTHLSVLGLVLGGLGTEQPHLGLAFAALLTAHT